MRRDIVVTLLKGLRNVVYDTKTGVVFVKNKLKYKLGGRPELNAKSIIGDFRHTQAAQAIWGDFRKHHEEYLNTEVGLIVLETINRGSGAQKDQGDQVPGKRIRIEGEPEIEALLAKYGDDLDKDDLAYFHRAWRHLTTNRTDGKPISLERRLSIINKMAKYPALQIGRAAYLFIDGGCHETGKNDRYFFAIVNQSAKAWLVEYRAALDRKKLELT